MKHILNRIRYGYTKIDDDMEIIMLFTFFILFAIGITIAIILFIIFETPNAEDIRALFIFLAPLPSYLYYLGRSYEKDKLDTDT